MLKRTLPPLSRRKSLLGVVLLLIYIGWTLYNGSDDKKQVASSVRVQLSQVKRQDVPVQVSLVGTVVAYETVAIKSRLDSQVMEVHFRDGDSVKEGQVLFDLDDRAIKAQIGQYAAALEKEKAQLVNADLQYRRAQKLVKTHVVAQAQVDETKAAYEAQLAQVNAAQANLDNARVQLTYTSIKAPISGRTGTINVTRGNNVKANDTQPLVTINQTMPIRVQFAIPQRYYQQVRGALSAGNVAVKAQSKELQDIETGRLEYLDNAIDVSNGTFSARAVYGNSDEKLWPGMFVNITLDLGVDKNVLTIPSVAVQGDEGNHFVFIASEDGKKAVRTPVTLTQSGGDLAVVTSGLNESNRVIIDGILRLTDGAAIEPYQPPAP